MESSLIASVDGLSLPLHQSAQPPLVKSASATSEVASESSSVGNVVLFDGPEEESFHDDVEASARAVDEPSTTDAFGLLTAIRLARKQTVVAKTALVVSVLFAAMNRSLPKHLVLLRNLRAGTVIFMIGDWAAQLLTHHKVGLSPDTFQLDVKRFIISTVLGCFWGGYINPSIYAIVESFLPGKSVKLVLIKMLVTCSILSTWGNYTTMMFRRVCKQLWEGPHEKGFVSRAVWGSVKGCNHDFWDVLRDDLKIWPLYDITCYSLIPPNVRPITSALMASAWAMYMSIASAKPIPKEAEE